MPKLLNPKKHTLRLTLEDDADVDPTPAFIVRAASCDDMESLLESWDRISEASSQREMLSLVKSILTDRLVTWEDLTDIDGNPIPFDPKRIGTLLTLDEMMELCLKVIQGNKLDGAEKKPSRSQLPSSLDNSATAAAPASA